INCAIFFFSSRRRHTRCLSDWSSDVCSSDLGTPPELVLSITGVAAGGDGIARAEDGRVVFVEGALPGERVQVVTIEEKRDYLRRSEERRVGKECRSGWWSDGGRGNV